MNRIFVPPIKIQGIKTKLVPWILDNVDFPMDGRWVEPFMGSGVVGFNFSAKHALFCDTNPHLINFYLSIKEGSITSAIAKRFLEKEGKVLSEKGQEHYYYIRDRFNEAGNPLDFLFLNRSCFNGMIRFNSKLKFNVPFGHKPERFSQAYITKITNQIKWVGLRTRMNDWEFKCQSFTKTLSTLYENDFVYCDPPYIGRHVDYYDSWDENNEFALHDLLINSNVRFILSTWDTNKYRSNSYLETVWSDCNKINKTHFYHLGGKEENRNEMLEALILNYQPINKSEPIPYKERAEQLRMFMEKNLPLSAYNKV